MATAKKFHLDKRAATLAEVGADKPDDDLLTPVEVAEWLGVCVGWLEDRRRDGDGPPFARPGPKTIRYLRADVIQWLRTRTHLRTSEYMQLLIGISGQEVAA